jgi:hypothetical protein
MSERNPRPDVHWGTTLDQFLSKEGVREAVKAEALARVVAWQTARDMARRFPRD